MCGLTRALCDDVSLPVGGYGGVWTDQVLVVAGVSVRICVRSKGDTAVVSTRRYLGRVGSVSAYAHPVPMPSTH